MKEMQIDQLEQQLKEWQDKLQFFQTNEVTIVDLEQKYNANKKIEDAQENISRIKKEILDFNTIEKEYPNKNEIKTLHQALDLFIQNKDKLGHKTTQNEFEEIEKLKNELFEQVFGEYQDKVNSIPVVKNKFVFNLFETIISQEKLTGAALSDINTVRSDHENYFFYDRSAIVSALTLSTLNWQVFDHRKIELLIDLLTDFEDEVWERALTGIILSVIIHQNRLQRFPTLIKRLESLQNIEKIQIGIYLLDTILRNQLYEKVIFPKELDENSFLNKTPYNWFYPFYTDNSILLDAIKSTNLDIDTDDFKEFLKVVPLVNALKYSLCHKLRENTLKFQKVESEEAPSKSLLRRIQSFHLADSLNPYYNLVAEIYLYFKHFPKDRIETLFNSKTTLAQTKLKNIILSKTQSLKLVSDLLYEQKEFNSCIKNLKELLNIEPNQISALNLIAICFEEKEEYSEALSYYLQIERIDENNLINLMNVGLCLAETKQYKKSNEYFHRVLEADGKKIDEIEIYNFIAENYFNLTEYILSNSYNDKVIELDKNNEDALFRLNRCYSLLNIPDKALEYSLKLYDLDPEDPMNMIILAQDYSELNRISEALELAEKGYKKEQKKINVTFNYGRVLFLCDKIEKSKEIFLACINLKDAKSYLGVIFGNLGHTFLIEKNLKQAMFYYQKCVLEFDNISEFEEKFDLDLKYLSKYEITRETYVEIKKDMVVFWQENK